MAHPIETPPDLAEDLQPGLAVIILEIDVFTPVTPAGDVIKTTGQLDSQGTCHGRIVLSEMS